MLPHAELATITLGVGRQGITLIITSRFLPHRPSLFVGGWRRLVLYSCCVAAVQLGGMNSLMAQATRITLAKRLCGARPCDLVDGQMIALASNRILVPGAAGLEGLAATRSESSHLQRTDERQTRG